MSQKVNWLFILLALFIVGAVYFPVLHNGYVWDDTALFVQSDALRRTGNFWSAIVQPILPGTTYFRPLVLATFAAEFRIFTNPDPLASHAINLTIHLLNCGLLFYVLLRVLDSKNRSSSRGCLLAGLGALFYGLHPALIEDVAWVASRFDLLTTTFSLLFLIASMFRKLGIFNWVLLLAAFLGGLFSKEMAVTIPTIAILFHKAMGSDKNSRLVFVDFKDIKIIYISGVMLCALTGYLSVKLAIMGETAHLDHSVEGQWAGWLRLSLVGETIEFYAKMVVWPFSDISIQHPIALAEKSNLALLISAAIALLYIFFVLVGPFALSRISLPWVAVAISFWPVLNFIPLTIGGNIGHDRFLAYPLMVLVIAGFIAYSKRQKIEKESQRLGKNLWLAKFIAILWFILCIVNIRVTVPLWKSELSIWTWAAQKYSDFPFVRVNYISSLLEVGDTQKAYAELEKPIPEGYMTDGIRFRMELLRAQIALRERNIEKAWKILEPMHTSTEDVVGQLMKAGVDYRNFHVPRSSQLGVASDLTFFNVKAEVLLGLRRFDEVISTLDKAAFISPNSFASGILRSFALYGLGRKDEGDNVFYMTRSRLTPALAKDAKNLRSEFLKQLCKPANDGKKPFCFS